MLSYKRTIPFNDLGDMVNLRFRSFIALSKLTLCAESFVSIRTCVCVYVCMVVHAYCLYESVSLYMVYVCMYVRVNVYACTMYICLCMYVVSKLGMHAWMGSHLLSDFILRERLL